MHLDAKGMSWDRLPVSNASLTDIVISKVHVYLRKARESGRRSISDGETLEVILDKLGLLAENRPTWAALLLFADEPARFLPQASLHCGRFRGATAIHDDRMLRGTIPEQIDEAMEFIRKNLKVDFAFTGQAVRDETWEYPLDALREALVNALCHRDYTLSSNTELRIYDDEMVISNPGGLPSGITLEDLHKSHVSVLRNRGIAGILYDMGFIEQWGSGITRMIESCKTHGLPEPEFSDKEIFRVLFRKDPFSPEYLETLDLNESQMHAIAYIKQNGSITNKKFRELMHLSDESARRNLILLQDKNIAEQKGRGRNIHYVLRKERPCKAVGD